MKNRKVDPISLVISLLAIAISALTVTLLLVSG